MIQCVRKIGVALPLLIVTSVGAQQDYPYCQILDRVDEPAWLVRGGYVTESDVDDPRGGKFSIFELRGGGGFAYFRTAIGDFDLGGQYDVLVFNDNSRMRLPDQVGALRLAASYIWRNQDAQAIKVDVWPGIYSDLEDLSRDDIYVPFAVSGIQAFNPRLSGVLGLALYPGFDREFDPRFGIRFVPHDDLVLDLMYPQSQVTFTPAMDWEIYAGFKVDRVSEYRLESGDRRKSLMYDETRIYFGLNTPLSETTRMMYHVGWIIDRSVDFDRMAGKTDVDDGYFVSVGIGGTL
jgi:hypothetical protein